MGRAWSRWELVAGNSPLQVLRGAEMRLHASREPRNIDRLPPGERPLALAPWGGVLAPYHPLVAHRFARDEPLAEAADGGEDDLLTIPGYGVGREGDSGGVSVHHGLD